MKKEQFKLMFFYRKSEEHWQRMDQIGRPYQKCKVLAKSGRNRQALLNVKSIGEEWTKSAGPIKKVLKV